MIGTPGRISKHRQFDPDTGKQAHSRRSSHHRKFVTPQTDARRPPRSIAEDRIFTITQAAKEAAKHPNDYLSSYRRRMNAFVASLNRAHG